MICPDRGSRGPFYRDGLRQLSNGKNTQRWLFRACGYRFSERKNDKKLLKQKLMLNTSAVLVSSRQLCALQEAKKLGTTTENKTVAGDLKSQNAKGKLVWFIWEMQKQNYSKDTIKTYKYALKAADLCDPNAVKETLARWNCSEPYKHNIAAAYTLFLSMPGLKWTPPRCRVNRNYRLFQVKPR